MAADEPPFLEPFLTSLASQGIRVGVADYRRIATALQARQAWTLPGLRDLLTALLARDREQALALPGRFDRFFEHRPLPADESVDCEGLLRELRALVEAPPAPARPLPPVVPTPRPKDPNRFPRPLALLLGLIALAGVLWIAVLLRPAPPSIPVVLSGPAAPVEKPQASAPEPTPVAPEPSQPAPAPIPEARFHHPEVTLTRVPFVPDQAWHTPVALASASLLALLFCGVWVWRRVRIPRIRKPQEDPGKPRLFSIAEVGGDPAPRFDADTLDAVADALGHTRSQSAGGRLDVAATVRATLARHGVPQLVFAHRRRPRGVLLLLDDYAQAAQWNPVAAELAEGLRLRGVACTFGRFRGDPEHFVTPDGRAEHLEDWEDRRTSHLLLLVSDGHGLDPARRRLVLERLRHWPSLAWLDPREPRAWDAFTGVPAAAGIPLYPATPRGVLGAVIGLVGEQGAGAHAEQDQGPRLRAGLPRPPYRAEAGLDAPGLAAYLEQGLGDALPWAQTCTLVQPIPPGLAERLRERFFPDLPAAAIERLYTLPGTGRSVAGLHFSLEVQGALRQGFVDRSAPQWRREVIAFLLAQVDRARPDADPDSLRLLAWELARERLALEGDPEDPAHARRLAELAETSLGDGLRDALAPFGEGLLPLLDQSRDPRVRTWLSRIAGDPLRLGQVRRRPVGPARWVVLGLLSALTLGAGGLGYQQWRHPTGPDRIALDWQVQGEPPGDLYTLIQERLPGEPWRERAAAPGLPGDIAAAPWEAERQYRLALVAGGAVHPVAELSEPTEKLKVVLAWGERPRPCREPTGLPGLERRDCPDDIAWDVPPRVGWRQRLGDRAPDGRMLSIALALQGPGKPDVADTLGSRLLSSGSVDRVYRLSADPGNPTALQDALERIAEDLAPALGHAQLLAYGDAAMLDGAGRVALTLAAGVRGLHAWLILPGAPVAWEQAYAPVLRLLEPGKAGPVGESDLLAAVGAEQAGRGGGAPVVLIRPARSLIAVVFHVSPEDARITLARGARTLAARHGEAVLVEPGPWQVHAEAAQWQPRDFEVEVGPETASRPIEVVLQPVEKSAPDSRVVQEPPPAPVPPAKVRLTVTTTPPDARVRLMNVKPSYQAGMSLDPGRYDIEVSAPGFQTRRDWYALEQTGTIEIALTAAPDFAVFHDTLKDGSRGPEMVSLPGGTFKMGSPEAEAERYTDEGPRHEVRVQPFAIGRTEVTFADYDRFAQATRRRQPDDRGWGRGEYPVINVSWADANAYAAWLAAQTGKAYRLPSEAEWEYAARAGTETPFWTGACIDTDQANYNGNYGYQGCGTKKGVYREKTVPVASLPPNPWGLYGVAGNVWEWVQDTWHDTYRGAPDDGRAWEDAGGRERVLRGGGWLDVAGFCRSAYRNAIVPASRNGDVGFRLSRGSSPPSQGR